MDELRLDWQIVKNPISTQTRLINTVEYFEIACKNVPRHFSVKEEVRTDGRGDSKTKINKPIIRLETNACVFVCVFPHSDHKRSHDRGQLGIRQGIHYDLLHNDRPGYKTLQLPLRNMQQHPINREAVACAAGRGGELRLDLSVWESHDTFNQ